MNYRAIACWTLLIAMFLPLSARAQCTKAQCTRAQCNGACVGNQTSGLQTVFQWQPFAPTDESCQASFQECQVIRYRPVWETRMREQRVTIARRVTESSEREEPYTLITPVWETKTQDASYDQVSHVNETHYREQRFTVMRAVTQTETRAQRQIVRRYVRETVHDNVQQYRWQPVTNYHSTVVERGGYQTEYIQKQKLSPPKLSWTKGQWVIDPTTGTSRFQPAGLAWVKTPGQVETVARKKWVSNPVTIQVPQTTYQQVAATVKTPRQVGRWVDEEVVTHVPFTVKKMVPEEQVRQVPYTVTRQVVQRIERQAPVQVCRYVYEQKVRRIPVTQTRVVFEEHVQQVPVRFCRFVPVVESVAIPGPPPMPCCADACSSCAVGSGISAACCASGVTMPLAIGSSCCGITCGGTATNELATRFEAPSPRPARAPTKVNGQSATERRTASATEDGWYPAGTRSDSFSI
jgi:hypothetical protein